MHRVHPMARLQRSRSQMFLASLVALAMGRSAPNSESRGRHRRKWRRERERDEAPMHSDSRRKWCGVRRARLNVIVGETLSERAQRQIRVALSRQIEVERHFRHLKTKAITLALESGGGEE